MFSSQNSQVSNDVNYIEDVFSTYLRTSDGTTANVINNINLSGKGGLVWTKNRGSAQWHVLYDTARGGAYSLTSNNTNEQRTNIAGAVTFNADGYSIVPGYAENNASGNTYVDWTFREQPKFFDVVTYTGNGGTQIINHSLASTPGCVIIKQLNATSLVGWVTYHRSVTNPNDNYLLLNTTGTSASAPAWISPTSTSFALGNYDDVNKNANTYVAYLFAHDAGGFGLTGTDNVISCGSYVAGAVVNLGWEPQYILSKRIDSGSDWWVTDTMRGWPVSLTVQPPSLSPNTSGAESASGRLTEPTATGFNTNGSGTYIYIAIRRGPMKVPTLGTSVYSPLTRTGTGTTAIATYGFATDLVIPVNRPHDATGATPFFDKLRGVNQAIYSNSTSAEENRADTFVFSNTGVTFGTNSIGNSSGASYVNWAFQRAPGFFDEVCYTGTGAGTYVINHNLGVIPTFMIFKQRSVTTQPWFVELPSLGFGLELNNNSANHGPNLPVPTATTITSNDTRFQTNGVTYVAYLFATAAGVSKVGSYTGTGALQTVACGFTSGARFVLIKRTDSTGDWYVWDSARGITSGNDPYLLLNSTAAEVTGTNYVDTDTTGFKVTAAAPAALNAVGGTYIFLAIA